MLVWTYRKHALVLLVATSAFLPYASASQQCRALFGDQTADVSTLVSSNVTPRLQKRPTMTLDRVSQQMLFDLRDVRKNAGGASTTDERSEFKFFMVTDFSHKIIDRARALFPTVFSFDGRMLSGVASRDFRLSIKQADLETEFGAAFVKRAAELKILSAFLYPDVLAQPDVRAKVMGMMTGDAQLTPMPMYLVMEKIRQLAVKAREEQLAPRPLTYTDTASTAKFEFRDELSKQAFLDAAKEVGLDGSVLEGHADLIFQAQTLAKMSESASKALQDDLVSKLKSLGVKKDVAKAFVQSVTKRSLSSFVFRFRKYLNGPANASLVGLPAPGEDLSREAAPLKDAKFASGITWFELKIKTNHGEDALSTVVNKPRIPLSDSVANLLQKPSAFIDDANFARTSATIKADAQSSSSRVGVPYLGAEVDLALQLVRSIHQQKFSMKTVGRTVYTRDSYNVNFEDPEKKSHNGQVTIDSQVWELDRATGKLVEALPYVEINNNWHFQLDSELGWFVHRNEGTGEIEHVFSPRQPAQVFAVHNGVVVKSALPGLNLQPTVVTELKIPVEFIRLSPNDIARVPELAKIKDIFDLLNSGADDFNQQRSAVGLFEAAKNRGKRSFARNGNGGGIPLRISTQSSGSKSQGEAPLVLKFFQFNPESGYWINWGSDNKTPTYAYREDLGVVKINLGKGKDWLGDASPVYFEKRDSLGAADDDNLD